MDEDSKSKNDIKRQIHLQAKGVNSAENKTIQLTKRTFLSRWCFPNTYRKPGKELTDILIIFQKNIILIEDKKNAFNLDIDQKIAWNRWYENGIGNAIKQLQRAESRIRKSPENIFLDAKCSTTIPITLSDIDSFTFYRIIVARGLPKGRKSGDIRSSKGSLFFKSSIDQKNINKSPFETGIVQNRHGIIHIFNDWFIGTIFKELDTVTDILNYLAEKERYLRELKGEFLCEGEENLLAHYLSNTAPDSLSHYIPAEPDNKSKVLYDGHWQRFINSHEYINRRKANTLSYEWDELISSGYNDFSNVNSEGYPPYMTADTNTMQEAVAFMAAESRFTRRIMMDAFTNIQSISTSARTPHIRTIDSVITENLKYLIVFFRPRDYKNTDNKLEIVLRYHILFFLKYSKSQIITLFRDIPGTNLHKSGFISFKSPSGEIKQLDSLRVRANKEFDKLYQNSNHGVQYEDYDEFPQR